jgi:hypothetical protein
VVIHNLYVAGVACIPNEADPVLIIDTNAVLTLSIARKGFQPVSGRMVKLFSSRAALRTMSFRTAERRMVGGILRLLPVSQSISVSASRKLRITTRIITLLNNNATRYAMENFLSWNRPLMER